MKIAKAIKATAAFRPTVAKKKVEGVKVNYDPIRLQIVAKSYADSSDGENRYFQEIRWDTEEGGDITLYGWTEDSWKLKDASVHCTCPDFQFTFYPALEEAGSSSGKFRPHAPRKLKKGEEKKERAPRAVDFCGCCAHIAALYIKAKKQLEA